MRAFALALILTVPFNAHLRAGDTANQAQPTPTPPNAGPIISIPKQLSGKTGELIEVKAETGAELVTWKATDGLRIVNDDPPDPARKVILIHAKAAGTYAICASIPAEKGTRAAISLVTITGGVEPGPEPPKPTPVPPPVTDPVAFLVIIEETGQAVANRGAMFADAKLAARLKEHKIGWRTADQDVKDATGKPPADLVPYLGKAKGKPLPQVFLIAANGKMIYQGDLPADVDGLLALLAKHGG